MARVLLVDDAVFMRTVLKGIMGKWGHEVVGDAANGEEAETKYRELSPDFVLMDITMPKVDGIEGVRRIKAYDNNAKIIMCSAMGQQSMVLESLKAGACDFIVKPFSEDRIKESIHKLGFH